MQTTTDAGQFAWEKLPVDHPLKKLDRRRIIGENLMLSHVKLHKGCDVPSHCHENEQMAVVLSGAVRFGIGDPDSADHRKITLHAGEVLHLPSNVPHSAFAEEDSIVLDAFSPPSEFTGIDQR